MDTQMGNGFERRDRRNWEHRAPDNWREHSGIAGMLYRYFHGHYLTIEETCAMSEPEAPRVRYISWMDNQIMSFDHSAEEAKRRLEQFADDGWGGRLKRWFHF